MVKGIFNAVVTDIDSAEVEVTDWGMVSFSMQKALTTDNIVFVPELWLVEDHEVENGDHVRIAAQFVKTRKGLAAATVDITLKEDYNV